MDWPNFGTVVVAVVVINSSLMVAHIVVVATDVFVVVLLFMFVSLQPTDASVSAGSQHQLSEGHCRPCL